MARKVKTKKQKIIDLLAKGVSVNDISERTGASTSYIYLTRSKLAKKKSDRSGISSLTAQSTVPPIGISAITHSDTQRQVMYEPYPLRNTASKKSLWQRVKEVFRVNG